MKPGKKAKSFFYKDGRKPLVKKRTSFIKRTSPFLLLAVFLILFFVYEIINNTATTLRIILFPFIIANLVLADFALWNYFEGKKRGIIWIIESVISTMIIYFFA